MRMQGRSSILFGSIVSIFALGLLPKPGMLASEPATTETPFDQLPKVLDASMPRDQQMSIARSAAPDEVADKATVYVLGSKGFEKAREGTNGVSCIVTRHFVTPTETSIEPMCYDAEGSRTLLLADLYAEELRSKGTSETAIKAEVANGYKAGRFKAPSKPGIRYMLSSDNRLGPTPDHRTVHVPPHLMFYAPYMTGKDLGFDSDSEAAFLVQPRKPDTTIIVFPDPNLEKPKPATRSGAFVPRSPGAAVAAPNESMELNPDSPVQGFFADGSNP